MTINHRKQNCGRIAFFRDPLECLLIGEGNEAGKYIFGLCFPIGPADTGRPLREPEVGRQAGAEQAGAGARAGPRGALLSQQEDERKDEGKHTLPTIRCHYCSQKLDELEKNGNCSYPVGEKATQYGVARKLFPYGII